MKYYMAPRRDALPTEVIYLVLEEVLRGGDSSTLKAMSLVSQEFLPLCRSKLFRDVTIKFASDRHYSQRSQSLQSPIDATLASDVFLQFMVFLIANPPIIKSIRHLALLDISAISFWSTASEVPLIPRDTTNWSTISKPLVQVLAQIEDLQTLEIRSEIELDWTTFDAPIKRSIYGVLQRSSAGSVSLKVAGLVNIHDADLCMLLSTSTDITFARACFSLQGPKSLPVSEISISVRKGSLQTVKLGRNMGNDALDMVQYYPETLAGVRRLILKSLSDAASVSQFWTVARAARGTLNHLEWWFEDLAYRAPQDAIELQRMDLSIFSELRSVTIRSSQTGLLINLMVILEATGAGNRIESISIVMPSSIDKFLAFRPSAVWKRLDTVLGSAKFQRHLRQVALSFAWTNQPIPFKSIDALFSAFKKNLPSLRGKDLTVGQERVCPF